MRLFAQSAMTEEQRKKVELINQILQKNRALVPEAERVGQLHPETVSESSWEYVCHPTMEDIHCEEAYAHGVLHVRGAFGMSHGQTKPYNLVNGIQIPANVKRDSRFIQEPGVLTPYKSDFSRFRERAETVLNGFDLADLVDANFMLDVAIGSLQRIDERSSKDEIDGAFLKIGYANCLQEDLHATYFQKKEQFRIKH